MIDVLEKYFVILEKCLVFFSKSVRSLSNLSAFCEKVCHKLISIINSEQAQTWFLSTQSCKIVHGNL